ncbi:GNAT family N-acetyltransferase [Faecalispora anaeroviscerum]|uniref:GNAT family N-acetyltransferase n=1 Tax=Faecalispora anaeroviscerum TaxID=2991836 RepID=UPI0024B931F0|nr:GNAT family N-acetyltransferase [Faecalispora anaeroviscerum]
MIRLLTESEIPLLERFCEGSPFGCKIAGLQRAYGLSLPFARFWVQTDEQEEVTAAVSSLDGAAVLHWNSTANRDELKEFFCAAGCRTLLCSESAADALYGGSNRAGELFVCPPVIQPMAQSGVVWLNEVPVRELFSLLCECGEQRVEQFEPFYLDVSHRVRHGASLTQGAVLSGKLAACAMAGSMTESTVVLSAVAVHPDVRRKGLGGAAVRALLLRLLPRRVYVLCENERARLFYQSLSFSPAGRWAELDLLRNGSICDAAPEPGQSF